MIHTLCSVFFVSGNLDYSYYQAKTSTDGVPDESRSRVIMTQQRIRLPDAKDDISSSESKGQSVRSGGKAGQKFSSKDGIAPGYQTRPFPKNQADAGSWLGTKNALHYCAQSTNTSPEFFSCVHTRRQAIVSLTACLAHALKKCTQSGNFQFDIKSPSDFKIVCPKTKDTFPKIQASAYNRHSCLHQSHLA